MEIFVAGGSRTGTHLISLLLSGGDSPCFMFHELHFWERMAEGPETLDAERAARLFSTLLHVQRGGVFDEPDPAKFLDEARSALAGRSGSLSNVDVYWEFLHYEASAAGRSVPIEQTPRNLFFGELILAGLPDARMIIMQRDPRDVVLSQRAKWKMRARGYSEIPRREALRTWSNYHPITVSLLWRAAERRARDLAEGKWSDRVFRLSFESLVGAPEQTLERLCDWLHIEYSPAMLDIPRWGSSHEARDRTARGVDRSVAVRWPSSGATGHLALCQWTCGDEMKLAGYEPVPMDASWLAILSHLVSWPVKTVLALTLNRGRNRSLLRSVKRRLDALTGG